MAGKVLAWQHGSSSIRGEMKKLLAKEGSVRGTRDVSCIFYILREKRLRLALRAPLRSKLL